LKPKGKGSTAPSETSTAAAAAAAKGAQEEAKGGVSPEVTTGSREQAKGQSVAGDFVLGLRAGPVVPTQQILENLSSGTSVGPLVNLEGYYVLREWVRLGMMFEWHQYDISS